MIRVRETPSFRRHAKRLRPNQKADLNRAIRDLAERPLVGERKSGDLSWVRVWKCRLVGQLSLLAYEYRADDGIIILHAIGSHENFYRDLKTAARQSEAE